MKIEGPLNLPQRELSLYEEWNRTDLPGRVAEHRRGARPWVTYEGPPTVNGVPALHHVFTSTHKDIYPRFQTMRGRYVQRRAGWDCQGLPVEINVERKLGLEDKQAILRYGVDRFIDECRAFVDENIGRFEAVFKRTGFWVDYDNAYRTMDDSFVESVWWHLQQVWNSGDLYEGHKVVPYCTRCGTALSSHELGQPGVYSEEVDRSAYVAFKLVDRNASLVIWTTTPWTLPSNVAVAIDPDREYGIFDSPHGRLIIATDRASEILGDASVALERILGRELIGASYTRPYELVYKSGRAGVVVGFDEVEAETGSGLVHLAPAFGEVDAALGAREGLAVINPVDAAGRYTKTFAAHEGQTVHEAVDQILDELATAGTLVHVHDHAHSYPHCWRCQRPLIYWAKPSWYIRTSAHRQELIDQNQRITWYPETIKEGRFGNWLRGNVDWALSRDRFWGTPLPLWQCPEAHVTCVGSRAELAERAGLTDVAGVPTHRPEIDRITFPCPDCGARATRIEAVGDVWLDSGCVPAAQWGYPAQTQEEFTPAYPADFISEAIDQTRGWFYSLLAINTLVRDSTPFRNAVCLGLLVDDDGRKMSKSLDNVVDPVTAVDRFGADAVRWYLLTAGAPWSTRRVSFNSIQQCSARDLDTLWNVAAFYVRYAELTDFDTTVAPDPAELTALDRWIISRSQATIQAVTDALEDYAPHIAGDAISAHLDELSNWFVRRSRPRFWDPETHSPGALRTLHSVLVSVSQLLAPFCPFLSDIVFQGVQGEGTESVHLSDWPTADPTARDEDLEAAMAVARLIAQTGRAARSASGLAVRQPLAEALVTGVAALPAELTSLIKDELNVKQVVFDDTSVANIQIKPNWRRLGPRFRAQIGAIADAVAAQPTDLVAERIRAGHSVTIEIDGGQVDLSPEDLIVTESELDGWSAAREAGLTVALDTKLDESLLAEGRARDLIRQIQLARQDAGLHVADRIALFLAPAYLAHSEMIGNEVLARSVASLDGVPEGAVLGDTFGFVVSAPFAVPDPDRR